jgi:hypothetical protein
MFIAIQLVHTHLNVVVFLQQQSLASSINYTVTKLLFTTGGFNYHFVVNRNIGGTNNQSSSTGSL